MLLLSEPLPSLLCLSEKSISCKLHLEHVSNTESSQHTELILSLTGPKQSSDNGELIRELCASSPHHLLFRYLKTTVAPWLVHIPRVSHDG